MRSKRNPEAFQMINYRDREFMNIYLHHLLRNCILYDMKLVKLEMLFTKSSLYSEKAMSTFSANMKSKCWTIIMEIKFIEKNKWSAKRFPFQSLERCTI